jgi:hypothetical protein
MRNLVVNKERSGWDVVLWNGVKSLELKLINKDMLEREHI